MFAVYNDNAMDDQHKELQMMMAEDADAGSMEWLQQTNVIKGPRKRSSADRFNIGGTGSHMTYIGADGQVKNLYHGHRLDDDLSASSDDDGEASSGDESNDKEATDDDYDPDQESEDAEDHVISESEDEVTG